MAISTRQLPLTALRTFESAARNLSFKRAADELCVSPTTVSNQIRWLERKWRCQLFIRKTRAVDLTEKGKSLSDVLSRAFGDILNEVETEILDAQKTVTLAVGPIFGTRWLGPKLSQFRKEHPDIQLVISHGSRITSEQDVTTDIVVDWGKERGIHCAKKYS